MTTAPVEQSLAINTASDDEIDLRQVAGALGRRWPWIAGGGALGLLLAGFYLLLTFPLSRFTGWLERKMGGPTREVRL